MPYASHGGCGCNIATSSALIAHAQGRETAGETDKPQLATESLCDAMQGLLARRNSFAARQHGTALYTLFSLCMKHLLDCGDDMASKNLIYHAMALIYHAMALIYFDSPAQGRHSPRGSLYCLSAAMCDRYLGLIFPVKASRCPPGREASSGLFRRYCSGWRCLHGAPAYSWVLPHSDMTANWTDNGMTSGCCC